MAAIKFVGISGARARLQTIVNGLRDAAGGEAVARAAAKVQAQIDAVSKSKLTTHKLSGNALAVARPTHSGGLIQLTAPRYVNYHGWWPFRRGMPPFVVKRAAQLFAAELLALVSGKPSKSAVLAAATVLSQADAAASRAAARKAKAAADRVEKLRKKREGG